MPFGLPGSRSSSKSSMKSSLNNEESGRMYMSGILHDGLKTKSTSKSKKSPTRSPNRLGGNHEQQQPQPQQQQQYQYQYQHQQQQQQVKQNQNQNQNYQHQHQHHQYQHQHTPPRSKTPSGRSPSHQRPRSNNRYPPSQYQQIANNQYEPQHHKQYDHVVIPQSHSNQSHSSRNSSHSKQSNTSASAQHNRSRFQHRRTGSNTSSGAHSPSSSNASSRYHNQHRRVPSANSEIGSVHSLPSNVTSRSTISNASSHSNSRNGGRSMANSSHQYGMPEHRDPHGETTNTRRTQQYHTSFQTPQRNHHPHSSGTHHHPPATSFPPSPTVKPTPMKHSSGASVSSFHSRGSIMSYSSAAPPTGGKSTISATTSVVSKDKYAIKSTKKVIDELKKSTDVAYPMEKRIIALTNSCAEFDHLDDSRHNMELQQGAAVVLCKILALILNSADAEDHGEKGGDYGIGNDYTPKSSTATGNDSKFTNGTGENGNTNANGNSSEDNDNYDDALRMIATALEMVFRGQSMYVHSAYDKCGGNVQYEDAITGPSPTGLLPLLLKLLDRAEGRNNGYRMKQHNAEVALVNATKVILYLSRVPALRVHLARQPSLLDALSRVASKDIFNNSNNSSSNSTNTTDSNNSSSLSAEARIARVRIIANLVNQEENKSLLLEHRLKGIDPTNTNITTGSNSTEGVLDAILRVAHSDQNDRAREYASAALMDLASAPFNQIPMTKNEQLLGTLVKMIFLEKNPNTRESAITALQNLAFTKENRIRLVSFKRGVILEALIRALSNTNKDFNEKSRRRSAGALTNLACDESAGLMGRHKGLLQTLSIVSTKDESPEVQTRAAMALTKLAASITVRMDALPNKTLESESSQEQGQGQENGENGDDSTMNVYSTLLDALVVASLSTVSNSVSAVLRVKARDPENRYLMAKHPGILDTLADMCLYDNGNGEKNSYSIDVIKDRDNATRALMHLTNESKNRTIMCTPTVLEALVRGASVTDEEIEKEAQRKQLQDVRDSAIRAIERLATEFSNRHKMAHHDGLIVAIARATEREAKLEAGMANGNGVVIDEQPALLNGKGTKTATNDSVECSSYNSVMTPRRPGTNTSQSQQQQQDPQHAHLAKPLLMSLLVAM